MAKDSQNVQTSLHIKPRTGGDLTATGDLGVDAADANRLKYNRGTGSQRVLLQEDAVTAGFTSADKVTYDHTASGMSATNVQQAADELDGRLDVAQSNIATHTSQIAANTSDISSLQTNKLNKSGDTSTNQTLNTPTINNPTGLTKANVGLANVDNTSDATKNAAAVTLTNKSIDGTANTLTNIPNSALPANVVTTTGTQTLTNKTLTSPAITTPTGITKADVGLSNVDNTSDATKNAAAVTLTNKTLTSPVINTPTGITKSDVGLSNVDNTSDATKNAAAVTLTNKTLTAPIIDAITFTDQATMPTAPASGLHKVYIKTADGKAYIVAPGGTESALGSGGSSTGSKNYFSLINGDLETGVVSPWAGTSTTFVNGVPTTTSGVGSLTVARNTSQPLSGTGDLLITKPASNVQGSGFKSGVFTIDKEDAAKVLTGLFTYNCSSTAVDVSGTSTQTYEIWILDVTATATLGSNQWIQPTGYRGMNQNVGPGRVTYTFQTSVTAGQQYQVYVFTNQTGTTGFAVEFDSFTVGPVTAPVGAVITDPVAYTPTFTGVGTVTGVKVYSRRVGGFLEGYGSFTTGTVTGGTFQMTLGFSGGNGNITVDNNTAPSGQVLGEFTQGASNSTYFGTYAISSGGNNYINVGVQSSTTNAVAAANASNFASNAPVSFTFRVPITGWSSNVQMSSDTDTRVISWGGANGSSQSLTANVTDAAFTSINDRTGSWNGTQFRVPVSGDYVVAGSGVMGASATLAVFVNGTQYNSGYFASASTANLASGGSVLITNAIAGTLISLRSVVSTTLSQAVLGIYRLSGPSVIAATESVNATYGLTTAQAVGTNAVIKYDTKVKDTHNAFSTSTGIFTVPVSGSFRVSVVGNANPACTVYLRVNGVGKGIFMALSVAGNTYAGSLSYPCNAGDQLGVYIDTSSTLTSTNGTLGFTNQVTFERTGQ